MADLTSKIKLLIQSQDGANQDAKLFPILPIPATVGDALTCSRALNTATRVNSAGLIETVAANMPRITWERGVDQCPNLLVEKTIENINPYSEALDNAEYGVVALTVVTNQIVSPDGLITADFLKEDNTNTTHRLYRNNTSTVTNGAVYVMSAFIKPNGRGIYLVDDAQSAAYACWDSNGLFVRSGTIISTFTETWPNGWLRVGFSYTKTNTSGRINIYLYDGISVANPPSYLGDNVKGCYVWGLQHELNTFISSYIPTTTVKTRNADVISKTGIGTLLSGAKGLFADCYLQAGSLAGENVNRRVVSLSTGGGSNAIAIGRYEGIIRVIANNSGIDITDILITTPFKNKRIKVFVAFDIVANTLKMYVNGALVKSLTSFTAYTPSTVIDVGGFNGVNQWDGLIKAVAVTDEFTEADIEQISSYPSFANMAEQMMYEMV
jgi:hypothetical protein